MNRKPAIALALSAALGLGGFAFAQATGSQSDQSGQTQAQDQSTSGERMHGQRADEQIRKELRSFAQDPNTAGEKLFVLDSSIDNMREQQIAKLIQQKAQNQQVKQFAKDLEQHHSQAQQQLQQVAQAMNIQLPQQLPEIQQEKIRVLEAMPADKLEKQFIVDQRAGHAKDILECEAMSQTAENQQLKQYAQQTLPVLQQHEQTATQCAQALGLPSGMEAVTAGAKISPSENTGSNNQSK